MPGTGVFPVNNIAFKVGTLGRASVEPASMAIVKDMETFGIALDNGVEEWTLQSPKQFVFIQIEVLKVQTLLLVENQPLGIMFALSNYL